MALTWNNWVKLHWSELKENTPKEKLPKFNEWIKTQKEPYNKQKNDKGTQKKSKDNAVKKKNVKRSKAKNETRKQGDDETRKQTDDERNQPKALYTPQVARKIFKSYSDALSIPEMFNAKVVNNLQYKTFLEANNFFNAGYDKKFGELCFQYANTYNKDIIVKDPLFNLPLYLHNKTLRMGDLRNIVSVLSNREVVDFTNSYLTNRNIRFIAMANDDFDFVVINNNLNPIMDIVKQGIPLTQSGNRSGMIVKSNQILGNNLTEFWNNTTAQDVDEIYQKMNINQFDFNSVINLLQGKGEIRIRQQNVKYLEQAEKEAGEFKMYLKDKEENENNQVLLEKGDFVYHSDGWYGFIEATTKETISVKKPDLDTVSKFRAFEKFVAFTATTNDDSDGFEITIKEISSTLSNLEMKQLYLKTIGKQENIDVDSNMEPIKDTRKDLNKLLNVFNLNSIRNLGGGIYYLQFNM